MNRPKCYVESPMGFTPVTNGSYEEVLELLRPVVEPINPFAIAGEKFIPGILEAAGEEKQKRWNEMGKELYRIIKEEADMGFAILNGEPADFGVGCEMGYGYALDDIGYKRFPIVAYREDYRRSGETDNNLNAMALPPYMETGGCFIDSKDQIQEAVGRVALTLST